MALVDVAKKIDKARGKLGLPADEEVLVACVTNPRGTVGALAIGGIAGAAIQSKVQQRKADAAGDGQASAWPSGRNMMAITSSRVVLCSVSALSGKPTEISGAWAHSDILTIEMEKGKTAYPFNVIFADGSVALAEGAKGSGADKVPDVVTQIWG